MTFLDGLALWFTLLQDEMRMETIATACHILHGSKFIICLSAPLVGNCKRLGRDAPYR